jgi:hypothetical protein
MARVVFVLREGRTSDALFTDAAIANGWTAEITTSTEGSFVTTYDELVKAGTAKKVLLANKVEFTRIKAVDNELDGKTTIYYVLETKIPNPVTAVDYGKIVVTKAIDAYDAENQMKALKVTTESLLKDVTDGTRFV